MMRFFPVTLLLLFWAAPAAAELVEEDGYRYLQISLDGLWGGFFAFFGGIFAVLVGLYLYIVWRRADRQLTQTPFVADNKSKEDDEQVF